MIASKPKIAIIGAGGAGVCAALELSSRGYHIDLYEKASEPISKASFVNEGKIHLGFIYAMDRDYRTAEHMIFGSLHFMHILKRWIDVTPEDVMSTPFNYCVHRESLMDAEELTAHYRHCQSYFKEASEHFGLKYLDSFDRLSFHRLSDPELEDIANPEYIDAAFITNEYAIEPRTIAKKLRQALLHEDKINLMLKTKVNTVQRNGNKLVVTAVSNNIMLSEKYDEVINVSWEGMLEIDKSMGIEPPTDWSFRYKFGNKILIPIEDKEVPSCTMVQGPFGDTVNFKDKGLFLSWYPIGRTGWSEEHTPPDWDNSLSSEDRIDVFQRSFDEMARRIPKVQNIDFRLSDVSPVGGVIYALGNQDVDNKQSKLHTRHEVGIRSFDNYHTVNTGKYTLVPYTGLQIAERIDEKS